MFEFDAIPFFLDKDATDSHFSITKGSYSSGSHGVLRYEHDALLIEFVTTKNEYTMTSLKQNRTDIQTRVIPLAMVQSLEYKRWRFRNNTGEWKHVWNPKLIITVNSLKALEGIPTAVGNKLMLTLEVRGRQAARAFAAQVMSLLAERRLERIEAGTQEYLGTHLPPQG